MSRGEAEGLIDRTVTADGRLSEQELQDWRAWLSAGFLLDESTNRIGRAYGPVLPPDRAEKLATTTRCVQASRLSAGSPFRSVAG